MKILLRSFCLVALAALLCSCAATSVQHTWKSPDATQPVGKVAVIAIDERVMLRKGFENRFATQLIKAGAPAAVTYDLLSLGEIKQDKRAAADRFLAAGAEVVLLLRLVDVANSYREVQPGGERYAAMITGYGGIGWYDYYTVGFMSMSPTYGSAKSKVYLETVLFDLKSEKRLWSGLTLTTVKEDLDRVAEMDPLVGKIVGAMQKEGVIR